MKTLMKPSRLLWLVAALTLQTNFAEAQQLCLLREVAVTQLENRYDETVVGRGLVENGKAMVELFTSEAGTWTVVVTDTEGKSCVVASGESWMRLPPLAGDPS